MSHRNQFIMVHVDAAEGGRFVELNPAHIIAIEPFNQGAQTLVSGPEPGAYVQITLSERIHAGRFLRVWVGDYEPDRPLRDNLDLFWLHVADAAGEI